MKKHSLEAGKEQNYLLGWDEYGKLCYKLADKITHGTIAFDNIVCIARGGFVVGEVMSNILNLPLHILYVQRYKKGSKDTHTTIKPTRVIGPSKLRGNILVVDDTTDEGITLKTVVEKIKSMVDIDAVKSGVLIHKPHSIFVPDYYVKITPQWIFFPYEVCEYCHMIGKKYCPKGFGIPCEVCVFAKTKQSK